MVIFTIHDVSDDGSTSSSDESGGNYLSIEPIGRSH
jgi:hypothetical protein